MADIVSVSSPQSVSVQFLSSQQRDFFETVFIVAFYLFAIIVAAVVWYIESESDYRPLFFRKKKPNPLLCPTCGYDLRASAFRCPECGAKIVRPGSAYPEWSCFHGFVIHNKRRGED